MQSGKVVLFDVRTGNRVAVAGEERDLVLAADITADGKLIALGGPGKVVRVYSAADGKLVYEIKKHTDWITALEFSPDGTRLATGDRTGSIFLWEAASGGTESFTKWWNGAAVRLATERHTTLSENARLFAMLNVSMADAAIVAWNAKFSADDGHGRWRPITAIQQADSDGNAATTADPNWTPLIATPPFPAYTSGHSTFSSAAAAVLIFFVAKMLGK